MRGGRQRLGEQQVLVIRFGAHGARRLRRVERDVRLQRLAGFLSTEEIDRRLAQQRQPLVLVAHVRSFTRYRSLPYAACPSATAKRRTRSVCGRNPATTSSDALASL